MFRGKERKGKSNSIINVASYDSLSSLERIHDRWNLEAYVMCLLSFEKEKKEKKKRTQLLKI